MQFRKSYFWSVKKNVYYKLYYLLIFYLIVFISVYYFFMVDLKWELFSVEKITTHLFEISLAFIFYGVKLFLDVLRWAQINLLFGVKLSLKKLFYYSLVAPLFGKIIPIPQGESFYTVYCLKKEGMDTENAVLLTFLLKVSGFVAVLLLVPFSFFYYAFLISISLQKVMLFVFCLLIGFLVIYFLFMFFIAKRSRVAYYLRKTRIQFFKTYRKIKKNPIVLLQLMGLNFSSIYFYALSIWLLTTIYVDIDFDSVFCFIPFVFLSSIIPFVPGFILREGAWISLFVYLDYGKEESTAFGVLLFIFLNSFILIAFFLYLFHVKWKTKHD